MKCAWWAVLAVAVRAAAAGARAQDLAHAPSAPAPAPRPVCPPEHAQQCEARYHDNKTDFFLVHGAPVTYEFPDDGTFTLKCSPSLALDEPALPRFERALRVHEVQLVKCWPHTASYAAALRVLNVTDAGAGGAPATPAYVIHLSLFNVKEFDPNVLTAMPTLRNLSIYDMNITGADLALLPPGIQVLGLLYTGIGRVPAAALAPLPHLAELVVYDNEPVLVEVEAAVNLSSLIVDSPATTLASLTLLDPLEGLELSNWTPSYPQPWRSCTGLVSLLLVRPAVEALPDGWLARCARLRTLQLHVAANLTTLAEGALRGAIVLEEVRFVSCALETLPAGLLDEAPALRVLDLSNNHLHTLPGELFWRTGSLSELDLSTNNLTDTALGIIGAVTTLNKLSLDGNTALDACPGAPAAGLGAVHGSSPLSRLQNLTALRLAGTSTGRVCAGWRRLPRLQRLDLFGTPITRVNYTDLQFKSSVNITVVLSSRAISLRREDYESVAAAAPAQPTLTLHLSELRCDCELYWFVAALRLPATRLRVYGAFCEDEKLLSDMPLDELMCAAPGPCAEGCACATRDDAALPGPLLRVRCVGAGLRRVPRVDARAALRYAGVEPVALDLRLARNRIERLGRDDLPTELLKIDLRNNRLGLIDSATAAALVEREDRRVELAGNPLECSCRLAAALATLRAHPAVLSDWAVATCSNGTLLAMAATQLCADESDPDPRNVTDVSRGLSGAAVAALALGLGAVVALGLALAQHSIRRRLQRALLMEPPPTLWLDRRRTDDHEWMYDAFVSFAHDDEAVVQELVARLEGGAAPLRLCVHYRDWVPGGWIPAQIAASVRVSRRTVAVVSEAFLRSKWARAEFREAYAAALEDSEPRLVLVLLEDPARLPLDPELRAYVSGNTYVRWGDPWFWRKLRRALPRDSQTGPTPQMGPAPLPEPPSPRRGPPPASASSSGT